MRSWRSIRFLDDHGNEQATGAVLLDTRGWSPDAQLLISISHPEGSRIESLDLELRPDPSQAIALDLSIGGIPQLIPGKTADGLGTTLHMPNVGFAGRGTVQLTFYVPHEQLRSLGVSMSLRVQPGGLHVGSWLARGSFDLSEPDVQG